MGPGRPSARSGLVSKCLKAYATPLRSPQNMAFWDTRLWTAAVALSRDHLTTCRANHRTRSSPDDPRRGAAEIRTAHEAAEPDVGAA